MLIRCSKVGLMIVNEVKCVHETWRFMASFSVEIGQGGGIMTGAPE